MDSPQAFLGKDYRQLGDDPFDGEPMPPREQIEDRSYLSVKPRGIGFVMNDHATISAVQLHAAGHEGYARFPDTLPLGLDFAMDRDRVRAILGDPDRSGEESKVVFLGPQPAWDVYASNDARVHIEYAQGATSIRMVTLTAI